MEVIIHFSKCSEIGHSVIISRYVSGAVRLVRSLSTFSYLKQRVFFQKEACKMSWNLLTDVYNLQPERLYVTYFGGDEFLGLGPDLEVREIWREIGLVFKIKFFSICQVYFKMRFF